MNTSIYRSMESKVFSIVISYANEQKHQKVQCTKILWSWRPRYSKRQKCTVRRCSLTFSPISSCPNLIICLFLWEFIKHRLGRMQNTHAMQHEMHKTLILFKYISCQIFKSFTDCIGWNIRKSCVKKIPYNFRGQKKKKLLFMFLTFLVITCLNLNAKVRTCFPGMCVKLWKVNSLN